jgi:hypothetical protein
VGCPGQLARTTTIPHGPLDTLQAQEQVRHRGGDRRTHRGFEPGTGVEQVTRLTTAARPSSVEVFNFHNVGGGPVMTYVRHMNTLWTPSVLVVELWWAKEDVSFKD